MPAIESLNDALLPFEHLRSSRVEVAAVLLLDVERRPLGVHTVGVGSVNRVSMRARDVVAPALQRDAAAVILAHTHPSGDPTPSREDRHLTSLLRDAAEIVGVELVDHLILGLRRSYSFAEREAWASPECHPTRSSPTGEVPPRPDLPVAVPAGVLEAACGPDLPEPPRADTMTPTCLDLRQSGRPRPLSGGPPLPRRLWTSRPGRA